MNPGDIVRIEHALPHRVRLLAKVLAGHPEACERVARTLAASGPFARVTVRPLTGSILVEDDRTTLDAAALLERLREPVETERDEQGRFLVSLDLQEHPGPTRVARAVVHAMSAINADVGERLEHRADLATLLPVLFAAAGVAELGATGKMPVPNWYNLLWWSMRAFMTFNLRAVEEEVEDGPQHDRELGEIVNAL